MCQPHLLLGFRTLARYQDTGEVWVPGLQTLLEYEWAHQRSALRFESGECDEVDIDIPGAIFNPAHLLQGLTLYVNPFV